MDPALKSLQKTLKLHAKALGIPAGSADAFIDEVLKSVTKSLQGKSVITGRDLKRLTLKELRKYHKDFAYVYEICDIII